MVRHVTDIRTPIVIGAIGGSGTRVVTNIVKRLGVFMGSHLNESEDAMEFVGFYDRWINWYIASQKSSRGVFKIRRMSSEFLACVDRHRIGMPEGSDWGWKEPRSIYLLPFFHKQYPGMKFIHVDMRGQIFNL